MKVIWKLRQNWFSNKMSLILISNLNHVLKKIKLFSILKTKWKLKFSTWPSVIIYRLLSCLRWCASCSSKTICYVVSIWYSYVLQLLHQSKIRTVLLNHGLYPLRWKKEKVLKTKQLRKNLLFPKVYLLSIWWNWENLSETRKEVLQKFWSKN